MKTLRQMIAHMGWADALVIESLRQADPLDPRLLELFAHVLGAEHVWLARLHGSQPSVAVWPKLSIDECAALAEENQINLTKYVGSLDAEAADRPIDYRNSAGDAFSSTPAEILAHLAMHGSYHRGQIAWGLRDDGQVPRPTDYIAFARGAPTAVKK